MRTPNNLNSSPQLEPLELPAPEVVPEAFEANIEPRRFGLTALRNTWRRIRDRRQPMVHLPDGQTIEDPVVPESAILPEDIFGLPPVSAAETPVQEAPEQSEQHAPQMEQAPFAQYFDKLVSPTALQEERTTLHDAYQARSPENTAQRQHELEGELSEARQTEDEGRFSAASQALRKLEDDIESRYAIYERLGTMERAPKALALNVEAPQATAIQEAALAGPRMDETHFMQLSEVDQHLPEDDKWVMITREKGQGPIELPVKNFVYAAQLGSWQAGRVERGKVDEAGRTVESRDVIENYRNREAHTAPPLERVSGYVQPNGLILYATESGAHRTAAAVLRGDETIKTDSLRLYKLADNIVPLPEPISPSTEATAA